MQPDSMDKLFHALASAVRRQILDIVRDRPGASVATVSRHFDVSRIAVMKHLAVLEEAGLIVSRKEGRTRHLYFNVVPIQEIYERWSSEYSAMWAGAMTSFRRRIEQDHDKQKQGDS
jgi:DNA-binding transcriptional ArsR family regulator